MKSILNFGINDDRSKMKSPLFSFSFLLCLTFSLSSLNISAQSEKTIFYNGKRLYVGDVEVAKVYMNEILGKWDDGNGTKIEFFIESIGSGELSDAEKRHTEMNNYDSYISARIETYSQPYYFEDIVDCPFINNFTKRRSEHTPPNGFVKTTKKGDFNFDVIQTYYPGFTFSSTTFEPVTYKNSIGDDCGYLNRIKYWQLSNRYGISSPPLCGVNEYI